MRRLWIRFVLWRNGYCPKHSMRKTYGEGFRCSLCTRERLKHDLAKWNARHTYLDKLLEEWKQ